MQTFEDIKNKQEKVEIDYPCSWPYKVIGENADLIKIAIEECCQPSEVKISYSHTSKGGKYHSFKALVNVESEAIRLGIFAKLKNHPYLKMVL